MMTTKTYYVIIWALCCPSLAFGTVTISFDPQKAPLTDSVDIICTLTGSISTTVNWNFATTTSLCGSGVCIPDPSPHTYSMSGNVYTLTLPSATIGNCISYTCADGSNNADTTSQNLLLAYFDTTDIVPTEPGAYTDGSISVTTGCVLSSSDLTITWYKIENGVQVDFTADRPNPVNLPARSTCTRTCHSEFDEKVTNGFTHTEYTGSNYVEVEYKVTVKHSSYPGAAYQYTWTSSKYRLEGGTTVPTTTSSTTSPPTLYTTTKSPDIPVVIIVPSIVGGAIVILIISIIVCKQLRKTTNKKKKYRAENEEMPQVDINVTMQQ